MPVKSETRTKPAATSKSSSAPKAPGAEEQNLPMNVQPYLFFDGRCEEALEFYKKTLGAKVEMVMRFKDNPDQPKAGDPMCGEGTFGPDMADKVMHCSFRINDTAIMASDGMAKGQPKFEGFSLSYPVKTEAEADKVFAALAKEGHVQMPIGKTFFSPRFGCVADKFGVSWMIIVPMPM